jgi:uncharacterized protein (DUF2062 family)
MVLIWSAVIWRRRVRELASLLVHEHTEPGRVALAVLIGCVVACTPLFGFHLLMCLVLAWMLRLNKLVVYGAANLSIPPMIPFIGFASVQIGERVLHGSWLALDRSAFTWRAAPELAHRFFLAWLVGGLMLGAGIGIAAGALVYVALRRRRARHARGLTDQGRDPLDEAIHQATRRYRHLHPRFSWYVRLKYRLDPCYRAIAPLVREGTLAVDLGTGLGMLPVLLGVLGGGRRVIGVEWDPKKVAGAVEAAVGLPGIEAVYADVRSFALPRCDVITLVDVLHYYDAPVQRELLGRCHEALATGGRLLVREGDRALGGGARLTRFIELCATRFGWNKGPQVRFRPIADLCADLELLGFVVAMQPVAGRLYPGNVLLIAERADPAVLRASLRSMS